MKRPRTICSGFTLISVLTALMLLGVFTLVATRAFRTSMQFNTAAAGGHTLEARFESAMRLLRSDAWNAAEMTSQDNSLVLKSFDGQAIAWNVDGRGTITRRWHENGKSQVQRWKMNIPGIALAVHGAEVVVRVPEGPLTRPTERHLVNQRRIAEGLVS